MSNASSGSNFGEKQL